jgi:hypothetical protein
MIVIGAEKMKNDNYIGIPLTETAYGALRDLQQVRAMSSHVFHDKGERLYPKKVQRTFSTV